VYLSECFIRGSIVVDYCALACQISLHTGTDLCLQKAYEKIMTLLSRFCLFVSCGQDSGLHILSMSCREWNNWLQWVLQCYEAASTNCSSSWCPASIQGMCAHTQTYLLSWYIALLSLYVHWWWCENRASCARGVTHIMSVLSESSHVVAVLLH